MFAVAVDQSCLEWIVVVKASSLLICVYVKYFLEPHSTFD